MAADAVEVAVVAVGCWSCIRWACPLLLVSSFYLAKYIAIGEEWQTIGEDVQTIGEVSAARCWSSACRR